MSGISIQSTIQNIDIQCLIYDTWQVCYESIRCREILAIYTLILNIFRQENRFVASNFVNILVPKTGSSDE